MNMRTRASLLLGAVVIMAVLGMPLVLAGPMHHEMGCPFSMGQEALCTTSILEHLQHWQVAFASVLAEILLIAAFALVAVWHWKLTALPERSFARMRTRSRAPDRQTLFQELFSRGILNRKEPYDS